MLSLYVLIDKLSPDTCLLSPAIQHDIPDLIITLRECYPDLLIVLMYTWYSWHAPAHSSNLIIT